PSATTRPTSSDTATENTLLPPTTSPEPSKTIDGKACYQLYSTPEPEDQLRKKAPCPKPATSDWEPFIATSVWMTMQTNGPGATYTACDGIPRFKFSKNAQLTASAHRVSVTDHGWDMPEARYPKCEKPPSQRHECTVPEEYCDSLWSSYRQKASTFSETEPFQTA